MNDQREPALSVILATPDSYETIRRTVQHLRKQTVTPILELIIVAPSAALLNPDKSELEEFCRVRIVEAGPVFSIGSANAKGIREASAPVVALAEDHAFPAPGWAEALISAHQQPWAAVGPVVSNPNDPRNVIAWADILTGFGEYLAPRKSGVVERLPGNNSSYKRAILLEYGAELETMMETETLMQSDLRKRGYQLYLESAAQIAHLNFESLKSFAEIKFLSGRVFGAARAQDWSVLYRLFYAFGTPLIPVVRYRRYKKQWDEVRRCQRLPWGTMPMAWCSLLISATGELIGCWFGAGNAVEEREKLEFHRGSHLRKGRQSQIVSRDERKQPIS